MAVVAAGATGSGILSGFSLRADVWTGDSLQAVERQQGYWGEPLGRTYVLQTVL